MPSPATPAPLRRLPTGLWRTAALAVLVYYLLILLPSLANPEPRPLDLTFNSMLDHLLRGRADVDPAVVADEGFLRDGRVYAYWGILPALLRLPAVLVPGWQAMDMTLAYCGIAIALMIAVKLWTLRLVLDAAPAIPRSLAAAIMLVLVASGAQASFLRFSLYQEVCLWAGLWGAVFVAAAIHARLHGLSRGALLAMGAAAGAALLTRVSVGIGLIAALGLLLAVTAIRERAEWRSLAARVLPGLLVLAAAGLVTALVNEARWGDPLTFADYSLHKFNQRFPDRIARTAAHGLFSLERIPFGLVYYFVPIWAFHGSDGRLLLDDSRTRLIDSAELPPSSFLLTDPLLLLLAAIALVAWWRGRHPGRIEGAAVALGLAIPPLLMLSAISMAYRYRIDFYPLFEFLAFTGLAAIGTGAARLAPRLAWALAAISVCFSLLGAGLYLAGELGPGHLLIGDGIGSYYARRLGR